uniref:Preprohedistin n=1 Tax=Hediste diversicolor TaxID=126592 RepID=Q1PG44_HEDDI|nr:preprohedistin [Hediste diversicolor]
MKIALIFALSLLAVYSLALVKCEAGSKISDAKRVEDGEFGDAIKTLRDLQRDAKPKQKRLGAWLAGKVAGTVATYAWNRYVGKRSVDSQVNNDFIRKLREMQMRERKNMK